jgi:hypothetical protein
MNDSYRDSDENHDHANADEWLGTAASEWEQMQEQEEQQRLRTQPVKKMRRYV